MKNLGEFLRPRVYLPRGAEVAAASEKGTTPPFLPDNTDLTILYSPHNNKRDFSVVEAYLANADVYVPEVIAWNMEQVELLSRIAQGDKSARKQLEKSYANGKFNSFAEAETKALLGTGLRITIIDYSTKDKRADEILNHFKNWGLLDKVVPSWGKTLDNIINYARKEAGLEDYRENLMIQNAGPRLQTLITSDPELSKKERVNVVVHQGTAHSYNYANFEEMATAAKNTTITKVLGGEKSFSHFDQLAHTFRRNAQVSSQERRELAARALGRVALRFNGISMVIRQSDYHNGRLVMPPPDEMVERFSTDAIRAFHEQLVQSRRQNK